MAKVGRNDPCPCGSGKKYKHCHLRIDREMERRRVELDRAWDRLADRLWDFAAQERFAPDLLAAWVLWWDSKVPFEAAKTVDVVDRARFMDWFVFNFRTSRNRKRVAELYVEAFHDDLSGLERELVYRWVQTHLSVYTVAEAPSGQVEFEDIFTAEVREVQEAAELGLEPGNFLVLARLLPLGREFRLAPGAAWLPKGEQPALMEFLTPRYEAWKQARYGADWHDFLRESGYQLHHFLIRDMEPLEVLERGPGEMSPEEAARSIARRMQSRVIAGPLDAHYERWLDEPIPEWGNRSPREMAQTPEGWDYLEPVLDFLEQVENERAQSGQPAYDVGILRWKLGFTDERRTESGIIVP